jgi:DNA-directed RNA polymerase subunit K/omega
MADKKETQKSSPINTFKISMDQMEYTVYEKARMIGARALQISQGAAPLIEMTPEEMEGMQYNPIEIAKREFEAGVIPMKVSRKVPGQKTAE